ncbi:hypothetical protein CC80DRAFT_595294 [Byssothecium circinans]|uniref:Uncharacterized protein n=1 Tax=Byssothecium circinans TaxID=147558 RepID=A0A6A5TP11_9PLEO|nr:hypothetical protein CC80DRAFT_595294 [Byssothecium circinans]
MMYPLVKDIVIDAIERAKDLITKWPPSFPSIIEAENYVCGILSWKLFRYGCSPTAPRYIKEQVQARTHHGIAMKAYKSRSFTLDQAPRPKFVLWNAVEAGVKRATAVVKWYPHSFQHINAARAFVKCICKGKGILFETVTGVHPAQIAMYIYYHTARRAYEAGIFSLEEKPDIKKHATNRSNSTASAPNTSPPAMSPTKTIIQPVQSSVQPGHAASREDVASESLMQRLCSKRVETEEKSDSNESEESHEEHMLGVPSPITTCASTSSTVLPGILIDLLEGSCEELGNLIYPPESPCEDLGDLIDLRSPEPLPKLCNDDVDLIDLSTDSTTSFEDESFNGLVSAIKIEQTNLLD